MAETLNERAMREAQEHFDPEPEVELPKRSMFLGVDAIRLWRLHRKTRKAARKAGAVEYVRDIEGNELVTHSHTIPGSHSHSVSIEGRES